MKFTGDDIRLIRGINNLTVTKFAEMVSVSPRLVYSWERDLKNITPVRAAKIAEVFNINSERLEKIRKEIKPLRSAN